MRDYKNVKVPAKYRTGNTRTSTKRVDTGRALRRKTKDGPGLKRLLLNMAGLSVFVFCCWSGWQAYRFLTQADMFQISGVDVNGVHQLGEDALKAVVGPFTGQNIFRADLQAAVRRARVNPWIKEVTIHRSLPNRIAMTVLERVPALMLETGNGRYLMDSEAVVIDRVAPAAAAARSLPLIVMKDCRVHPGEPVTAEGITEALTLLAEIESRGGWKTSDLKINVGSSEALSIVYAEHEFKIGSGRYGEKLRRLAEIMADVKQRGLDIAYVDLRPENQAAVMVKDQGKRKKAR